MKPDYYGFDDYPQAIQTHEGSVVANVLLRQLRDAMGLSNNAQAASPMQVWERTLHMIRYQVETQQSGRDPGTAELAEDIARGFHWHYEAIAPGLGYKTRPESAVRWEDLPELNRAVMLAVVERLLATGVIVPGPRSGRPHG